MSNPETNDLPEGVIDADPAGGWESEDVIDDETRQRSEAEAVDAGLPSDAADAGDTATGHEVEANEDVESAEVTQGVDPDLATDDGAGVMADETQDGPALAQNAASDDEKLAGLVAQVRADLSGRDAATVERAIRSRLDDTGLALDADQVAALVAELAGTGGPAPERIPE